MAYQSRRKRLWESQAKKARDSMLDLIGPSSQIGLIRKL